VERVILGSVAVTTHAKFSDDVLLAGGKFGLRGKRGAEQDGWKDGA
jgi:hypothetical protein